MSHSIFPRLKSFFSSLKLKIASSNTRISSDHGGLAVGGDIIVKCEMPLGEEKRISLDDLETSLVTELAEGAIIEFSLSEENEMEYFRLQGTPKAQAITQRYGNDTLGEITRTLYRKGLIDKKAKTFTISAIGRRVIQEIDLVNNDNTNT